MPKKSAVQEKPPVVEEPEEISDDIAAAVAAEAEDEPEPEGPFIEPEAIVEESKAALLAEGVKFQGTATDPDASELGQAAFDGERAKPSGPVSSETKAEAKILREAATLMEAYGVPASANVLRVVADAVLAGTRVKS